MKKTIMWALTYRCNMNCDYCYLKNSEKLRKKELEADEYMQVAEKICNAKDWIPDIVWLTGGEATLNPLLDQLIIKFEANGIKTGVSTNGYMSKAVADKLINAKPRGINISLDFTNEKNDVLRGNTTEVIETLQYISKHKDNYTILGASVVLTNENIPHLYEMALSFREMGIEYISLNPHFNMEGESRFISEAYSEQIAKIKKNNTIKLPGDAYLDLLEKHYSKNDYDYIECPATKDYMFIAPWGHIYPCSNEFWHAVDFKEDIHILSNDDIRQDFKLLQANTAFEKFSTNAKCFNARCIGCWKLYMDDVYA
jgi:MoaA/NifB/PqqE/SkfB family radical SAM enzyme